MKANLVTPKCYFLIFAGFLFFNMSFSQERDSLFLVANNQYQSKKYIKAADNFKTLYSLSKKDTIYLYYAATSAVTGKDYSKALNYYLKLDSLKYTGISKEYFAKNIESKKHEQFDSKTSRDSAVLNKTHKNKKDKWSKSVFPEIIKNIALIYIQFNENEKALGAIKKARVNNKKSFELLKTEAAISHKLGLKNKFYSLLKEGLKIDKKNTNFLYNLGVLSYEAGEFKAAKKYYKKVLNINPRHVDALTNMSTILLSGEVDIIDEMNDLGLSKAENKRYDKLLKKRKQLIKKALPYLERIVEADNTNPDVINTLKSIYEVLGYNKKLNEIEALINQ